MEENLGTRRGRHPVGILNNNKQIRHPLERGVANFEVGLRI